MRASKPRLHTGRGRERACSLWFENTKSSSPSVGRGAAAVAKRIEQANGFRVKSTVCALPFLQRSLAMVHWPCVAVHLAPAHPRNFVLAAARQEAAA